MVRGTTAGRGPAPSCRARRDSHPDGRALARPAPDARSRGVRPRGARAPPAGHGHPAARPRDPRDLVRSPYGFSTPAGPA